LLKKRTIIISLLIILIVSFSSIGFGQEPPHGPCVPTDCLECGRAQQGKGGELDVERIFEWIAKVWLDPEVRKVIGEERWLEFIESLKSELQ